MKEVYLLWHTRFDVRLDGGEDIKMIGVYSSKVNAEAAKERTKQLKGFRDFKDGFEISCNSLDKDEWTDGL